MSAAPTNAMRYRVLGNTGLIVSVFSVGFWATLGVKEDLKASKGVEVCKQILSQARKAGINFFDNAEVYGSGEAEQIMGKALKELQEEDGDLWRRSDIVITTKLFWGGGVGWSKNKLDAGLNERGLSRKHIMEGMSRALDRLQMDYVDVVFCHRPDPLCNTAAVCRAMSDLVRSGKAMSWGTSEWSAAQIVEAFYECKMAGLEPPMVEQPQYNAFHRERFEREYYPLFNNSQYNIGTTIWSPLASGLLTGKYCTDIPENSRLAQKGYEWLVKKLDQWKADGTMDKVSKLQEYARDNLDCSVAQLSIAWAAKNPNVSTVLLGATSTAQLDENLKALPVLERLTDKDMENIEAILGNKPEAWANYALRPFDSI